MHTRPKRLRGMRDLTTIQGLAGKSLPGSREQIVAEQARLEHERSRLEREQAMWQENLARTSERLAAVVERLALLGGALEPAAPARPAPQPQPDRGEWHAIVLEY